MIRSRFVLLPLSKQLITQPNQAFTPRQIIEQFARNELIPTMNHQSDLLTDDNYTEDELLSDDVIEFEDDIEAQAHINEQQYRPYEKKQSPDPVRERSQTPSGEDNSGSGTGSETPPETV